MDEISVAVFFFLGSAVFWLAIWWIGEALEVVPPLFLPVA